MAGLVSAIGFFAVTYETYATRVFYLPLINAVNEGMLGIQALILVTAYLGGKFWTVEVHGIDKRDILITLMFVFAIISLIPK
jgi:hypothetical protein